MILERTRDEHNVIDIVEQSVYTMSRYSGPVRVCRYAYRPAHALRDEGVLRRPAVRPHAPGWCAVTPRLALAHRAC